MRVLRVPAGSTRADAWNAALRGARGEFAALLDQHDRLAPSALYEMACALDRTPACDLLYSDEDRISRRGFERHEPHFKPEWSPELLLASNYIGRMAMMRVAAATAAGGFRNGRGGRGGVEEWDLLLRLSRTTAEGRVVVSPPPTHAELAARISSHRELVTKMLNALEREETISRTRGAIVLTNPARLRRIVAEAG